MMETREIHIVDLLADLLRRRSVPLRGFVVLKVGNGYYELLNDLKRFAKERGMDIDDISVRELWEIADKLPFLKIKGSVRDLFIIPGEESSHGKEMKDLYMAIDELRRRIEEIERDIKASYEQYPLEERKKPVLRIVWEIVDKMNGWFTIDDILPHLPGERNKIASALAYLVQIGLLKREKEGGVRKFRKTEKWRPPKK